MFKENKWLSCLGWEAPYSGLTSWAVSKKDVNWAYALTALFPLTEGAVLPAVPSYGHFEFPALMDLQPQTVSLFSLNIRVFHQSNRKRS